MSTPKGYPTQEKDDRLKAEFATVEPVRNKQHGLSVTAHMTLRSIGTDAVEASSTTSVINATAHAAVKGDVISFTSGAFSGREIKVQDVATNTITLAETLSAAPGTGDTFAILRHTYPRVNASGELLASISGGGPIQFVKDAVTTTVNEDTVTPANNAPLPVKLTSITGDINITAGDLNVQLSHTGASFDSTRIGDGTTLVGVTVSNEMKVNDSSANTSLTAISGKLPATLGQKTMANSLAVVIASDQSAVAITSATLATEATLSSINTKTPALGQAAMAASSPVVIASDQSAVPVSAASLPLPTGAATEATLSSINTKTPALGQAAMAASSPVVIASDQSAVPVSAASLPLPTGAATEATLSALNSKVSSDYGVSSAAVRTAAQVGNATGAADFNSGAAGAQTLRAVLATRHEAVATPISVREGDGTDFFNASAVAASQLTHGALTKVPHSIALSVGWDGSTHRELSVTTGGALNVASAALDIVDLLDTPLLDASSTNIPGSAASPVEVVATLAAAVKKIQILDTTGGFFGVYTGAAASEVLKLVVGPGSDQTIDASIAAGTRISLRSMTTSAITSGNVAINFIG